jgi:hypothetical protein
MSAGDWGNGVSGRVAMSNRRQTKIRGAGVLIGQRHRRKADVAASRLQM